ncbi:MAG: PLP-dependent aminotransferase family protein [Alphaproteobacteria bacterium]
MPDLAGARGPRYLAIADAIERDIDAGALKAGDRLPPQRDLAWALGVTVGTVGRAYAEAHRRGLVGGQVGRGTYVNDARARGTDAMPAAEAGPRAPLRLPPAQDEPGVNWFAVHGDALAALDMSPNYPNADGMAEMVAAGLARLGDGARLGALVNYAHPGGRPEHRAAGARWLRRRGVEVNPDGLVISPGAQGGMTAVFSAITRPGDTILCEALSWPGLISFAWVRGLRARGVAMDRDGMVPEAFEEACARHRPAAAYLMPTMHNPTTAVLTEARRARIAEIARRYEVWLVEDDVYGFLAPDAPPPMRIFAPERAVYVSSLSKAVAPGLRIGFVAGPERLMPAISAALRTTMLMGAPLQSELAMHLIDSGLAEEAAERQRASAGRRQRLAAAMLGDLYDPRGGGNGRAFHLWMPLPASWRLHDFVGALNARGVSVTPGDAFLVNPGGQADGAAHPSAAPVPLHAVRVCLNGLANDDDLRHGLAILAALLRHPAREALAVI